MLCYDLNKWCLKNSLHSGVRTNDLSVASLQQYPLGRPGVPKLWEPCNTKCWGNVLTQSSFNEIVSNNQSTLFSRKILMKHTKKLSILIFLLVSHHQWYSYYRLGTPALDHVSFPCLEILSTF
jgi:hypothetical protein